MILVGLRARRVQVAEAHLPDLREFETPSIVAVIQGGGVEPPGFSLDDVQCQIEQPPSPGVYTYKELVRIVADRMTFAQGLYRCHSRR